MTREAFEKALDSGLLQTHFGASRPDRWYTCRRNGRTRTWKRSPDRFEIPIKFKFKDHVLITNQHFDNGQVDIWFRIGVEALPAKWSAA